MKKCTNCSKKAKNHFCDFCFFYIDSCNFLRYNEAKKYGRIRYVQKSIINSDSKLFNGVYSHYLSRCNRSRRKRRNSGYKNNITTYYDQDGNEVDITADNREIKVDESKLPTTYDLRDYGNSKYC